MSKISNYPFIGEAAAHTQSYLLPVVERILTSLATKPTIFELGCGNGANAAYLTSKGYDVIGVDPSESGIEIARNAHPHCRFELASTDDPLADRFGTFDVELSLEVIEHVYSPSHM